MIRSIILLGIWLLGAVGFESSAQQPLAIGTLAPVFSGTPVVGPEFSLAEAIGKGPVIVMFYRGQWCPYCNAQAKTMQDSLKYITALGGSVVAVSPEKTDNARRIIKKSGATFPFIHDKNSEVMNAYGVAYQVDEKTQKKLKFFGVNLEEDNEENGAVLPVPAVYIVGTDGLIKWVYFNENYKVRPSVAMLVAQLNLLAH